MAFGKVFGGVLGGAAAIGTLVVLPIVSVVNGISTAFEDNPAGKNDKLTSEYHDHNWEQFKEGASFGIYKADDGITAENAADIVYDGGKAAIESGEKFLDRFGDRLSEDFGGVVPNTGTGATSDAERCKTLETFDRSCFEDELPEPPDLD